MLAGQPLLTLPVMVSQQKCTNEIFFPVTFRFFRQEILESELRSSLSDLSCAKSIWYPSSRVLLEQIVAVIAFRVLAPFTYVLSASESP